MSYSLMSKNKDFRAKHITYSNLLDLAYRFGWKPMGTEAPSIEGYSEWKSGEWKGGYFSNDCQHVTEQDAKNIAESIKKAIQYIPDTDLVLKESIQKNDACLCGLDDAFEHITGDEKKDQLLSVFVGNKDYLKEFIDFCEDGGFCIF